jgi:hypothetical protein
MLFNHVSSGLMSQFPAIRNSSSRSSSASRGRKIFTLSTQRGGYRQVSGTALFAEMVVGDYEE